VGVGAVVEPRGVVGSRDAGAHARVREGARAVGLREDEDEINERDR
jgi:hypothetical protein